MTSAEMIEELLDEVKDIIERENKGELENAAYEADHLVMAIEREIAKRK